MLISPLATYTTRVAGTHVTLALGIALETASLLGASFATTIWQLFLSQGVAFGLGMGLLFVASVGIVPQWFTTHRSLANGFATSGSGLGGLLYSLATGAMLPALGLPWTFRVLALLALTVNALSAALLRDRNALIGAVPLAFDTRLFARPEYLLLNAYGFFSLLAYVVLIFSLANYARAALGLSAARAALISALLNLGQAVGRPPIGYFSDTLGRINMACLMTLLSGLLALALWTTSTTYALLILYALLGGAVAGTFWVTVAPVAAEVVGLKHVPSALNLEWLVIVLPATFSEPIALEIVAGTGGAYLGTQLFTGFMYVVAAAAMLLLRGWKIGEREELACMKAEAAAAADDVEVLEVEEDAEGRAKAAGRRSMLANCLKWRRV